MRNNFPFYNYYFSHFKINVKYSNFKYLYNKHKTDCKLEIYICIKMIQYKTIWVYKCTDRYNNLIYLTVKLKIIGR